MRKWNLLLTGKNEGMAGSITDNFPKHPKHYLRVPVVEIRDVVDELGKCEHDDDIYNLILELEKLS